MNWFEVCRDRRLADLPYKIELDKWGKIIMSPATRNHSRLQGRILRLLNQLLSQGEALPECAVNTAEGTKVADVDQSKSANSCFVRPASRMMARRVPLANSR